MNLQQLLQDYSNLAKRITVLENIVLLEQLVSDYAELENRISALESDHLAFECLVANPYHIISKTFRNQAEIDSSSVKVSNNPSGTNEGVVFDPAIDGAAIILTSSLIGYNRVQMKTPPIKTGELLCSWEYRASGGWLGNGGINTHKMFMIGTTSRGDNRLLEQRFHYAAVHAPRWRCDTRDYGGASGIESLQVANSSYIDCDEWIRYESRIDFTQVVPKYSVTLTDESGYSFKMYDRFPLDTFHAGNYTVDFFNPTWANSSSGTINPPRVHGWLRNVAVLWNPGGSVNDGS